MKSLIKNEALTGLVFLLRFYRSLKTSYSIGEAVVKLDSPKTIVTMGIGYKIKLSVGAESQKQYSYFNGTEWVAYTLGNGNTFTAISYFTE